MMSEFAVVMTALVPALAASGGGIAWVAQRADKRFNDLLGQLAQRDARIAALEQENAALRVQVGSIVRANKITLPMWTKNTAGQILWVSPRALRIIFAPLGLDERAVLGKRFSELPGIDPAAAQQIDELDRKAMRDIDSTHLEVVNLNREQLHPMILINSISEDEDGHPVYQGIAIRMFDLLQYSNGDVRNIFQNTAAAGAIASKLRASGGAVDPFAVPPPPAKG